MQLYMAMEQPLEYTPLVKSQAMTFVFIWNNVVGNTINRSSYLQTMETLQSWHEEQEELDWKWGETLQYRSKQDFSKKLKIKLI